PVTGKNFYPSYTWAPPPGKGDGEGGGSGTGSGNGAGNGAGDGDGNGFPGSGYGSGNNEDDEGSESRGDEDEDEDGEGRGRDGGGSGKDDEDEDSDGKDDDKDDDKEDEDSDGKDDDEDSDSSGSGDGEGGNNGNTTGDPNVTFDEASYRQLMAAIDELESTILKAIYSDTTHIHLDNSLLLQPKGQTFDPAENLNSWANEFGSSVKSNTKKLQLAFDKFHRALENAVTVFNDTNDLAAYTASAFTSEFPGFGSSGGGGGGFTGGGGG